MKADDFKYSRSPAKAVTHNMNRGLLPGNKFSVHVNDTVLKHFLSFSYKALRKNWIQTGLWTNNLNYTTTLSNHQILILIGFNSPLLAA
jgi:hypothetical protein